MVLTQFVETLNLLGDESRIRLCALLRGRELCVTDLVRITGISQSRVSTHLGRLREAGFVRDRRQGQQSFYGLSLDALPTTARAVLEEAAGSKDPTLEGDQRRLSELETERRGGGSDFSEDIERYYSPGRTWQSLAVGLAGLLDLGDALDVGSGDGAAASSLAPYCRTLTCIDSSVKMIEAARERLNRYEHVSARVADVHDLPFEDSRFDAVLMFHTLTYAQEPALALAECARVLRPSGRLVLLCLDEHRQHEVTAPYGELHPGFSPSAVRELLSRAGLSVRTSEVACRESRKPHLQVVLAVATKPAATVS
ncbi:MAG: metalloregulator ArsR/SmtB family transcription factor [Myxococcales bacterium]|nr:MAG: metalloregulator ArsR/SmtB family transcription factor [Myxococcales bacterium]